MISVQDMRLSFGERILFNDVNIKFTPGNCYGVIGANGSGKSTFLKILSGELESDTGDVHLTPGERIAVLRQDQNAFDAYRVIDTVIMGFRKLFEVRAERDDVYNKEEFTEKDGIRAAELETEFAELNGWEAEAEAGRLLNGLGISDDLLDRNMGELDGAEKVRVLLAQALFGEPDILLLDEPTNNLDLESVAWLEEFLLQFRNTVVVVSHDRHFLNNVCTHIVDIDYGKITLFIGNYDFWYESSELIRKQMKNEKKRREEKIAELKAFIQRFSSNVAKARQATSRQKLIEKLSVGDLKVTSRKFPYVNFKPERESGKKILEISGLWKTADGEELLRDLSLTVNGGDKIAFVGPMHQAKTAFFEILAGKDTPDAGSFEWGTTITPAYFPKDNAEYFQDDVSLIDWLKQYSTVEEISYVRGFLGRMLFSGEEALKSVRVLSGGEKVRCMLSKMMLSGANALIFDEPTNHLDLEAINALNKALMDYPEAILFASHDHQFVQTIANRIVEFTPAGVIDRMMSLDDYLANEDVRKIRDEMYHQHNSLVI